MLLFFGGKRWIRVIAERASLLAQVERQHRKGGSGATRRAVKTAQNPRFPA